MPGDGLAFAIRVGCENQGVGTLQRLTDGAYVFLVAIDDLVLHREAVLGVDGAVLGHEIAHVAVGGQDFVVAAEIFLDRLRLGWRFDDDQVLAHSPAGCVEKNV